MGAGLAGLCLAQSLLKRGVDVHVFERDAVDRPRRQGYRITIDRQGLAALKYCLPPNLFELVMATKGIPGGSFRFTDYKLRDVFALKFDTQPEDGGQVDRQTLHTILRMGLDDRIQFGKTAVGVDDTPDGALVRFSDGTTAHGSIVIAADGSGSALRQQIVAGAEPEPSPLLGIYGASSLMQGDRSLVPTALMGSGVLAIGAESGHGFFFTAMRFPESPVAAFERLAPPTQTQMRPQAPVTEDYVMWSIVFPGVELPAHVTAAISLGDTDSLHTFALEQAQHFHPALRAMVETSNREYTLLARFLAAKRPESWRLHRATLMGDAVHVMPPFGAHGGNTALRDAALLAEKLLEASENGLPPESAFVSYQREMEDYAFKAVAAADRSMRQLEMNPLLRWIMLKVITRFHRVTVPLTN